MMDTNGKHLFHHAVHIQPAESHTRKGGYNLSKSPNFPTLSDILYICSHSSYHIYLFTPSTLTANYFARGNY